MLIYLNIKFIQAQPVKPARSAEKNFREMPDIKSLLSEEQLGGQTIHLHKEGLFYVAYERSCLRRLDASATMRLAIQ